MSRDMNIPNRFDDPRKKKVSIDGYGAVGETVRKYYDSEELCDVILVAEETEFQVHKTIMSMRSDYFKAFFKNTEPVVRRNEKEIYNLDQEKSVFEKILQFIYGREDRKRFSDYEFSKRVMLAANEYLLPDYIEEIAEFFVWKVDENNFVDAANFAALFEDSETLKEVYLKVCNIGFTFDIPSKDSCDNCETDDSEFTQIHGASIQVLFLKRNHIKNNFRFCYNHHIKEKCWILDANKEVWNSDNLIQLTRQTMINIFVRVSKHHPNEGILLFHKYMIATKYNDFKIDSSWIGDWESVKGEQIQLIVNNNYMDQTQLNSLLVDLCFQRDKKRRLT